MSVLVPEPVRRKAERIGGQAWLDGLDARVASLARDWGLTLGRWYDSGTEAVVADADLADGRAAVLKVLLPQPGAAANEIAVLTFADGHGCAAVLAADLERGAVLLERLGPNLMDLGLPFERRQEVLVEAASTLWGRSLAVTRPSGLPSGLPSGADKARWLRPFVIDLVAADPTAISATAVEHALACAARREAAHDERRAVVVHGDVHAWNALQRADRSFALVDPDGLVAEPEYDLGVILREDPDEGDPHERARWLAARTGTDVEAILEWAAIERVATAMLLRSIGMHDVGDAMLAVAERCARDA